MAGGLAQVTVEPRQGLAPWPVLVLMHGLGADEHDLLPLVQGLPPELGVISLRAPHPLEWGGYMWYGMKALGEPDPGSFAQSLTLVEQILEGLREDPRWDARRLAVGGFSQGGVMALALLATAARPLIRATVVLSGYLPSAVRLPNLAGHPVFWGHGRQDPVIPAAMAEAGMEAVRRSGAQLAGHWYDAVHAVEARELADLAAWLRLWLAR